ncbi:MAG TPA: hypothetical protein VH352_24705 [Pseudonocardiaceae bacterium]|jgi:hypothetical protein|nr:hypothetical protein [Pseudonocardiaceae bacterium]
MTAPRPPESRIAVVVPLLAAQAPELGDSLRLLLRALAAGGHMVVSLVDESYHGPPFDDGGVRVCPGFHDPADADAENLRYWWLVRTLRKRVPADVVLTVGLDRPSVVGRALKSVDLADRWLHCTETGYDGTDPTRVTEVADRLAELARSDTSEGAICAR